MKELKWSDEKEANVNIRYNHIILVTPIGNFTVEWSNHYEYVTTIGNHLFYK